MLIKGLQKSTLIDYPGRLACTVFLSGCNFKCPYCHNPELVAVDSPVKTKIYTEEEIFSFLRQHHNFLDGVCISGGEPTLNEELPLFISKIKRLGYKVKLDTNGTNPEMLESLLNARIVDYVAMDFKAPLERYSEIANADANIEKIKRSISIIKKFQEYEFRITVVPKIIDRDDLIKIAALLKSYGATRLFAIQQFNSRICLDKKLQGMKPYTEDELKKFADVLRSYFQRVDVRV